MSSDDFKEIEEQCCVEVKRVLDEMEKLVQDVKDNTEKTRAEIEKLEAEKRVLVERNSAAEHRFKRAKLLLAAEEAKLEALKILAGVRKTEACVRSGNEESENQ